MSEDKKRFNVTISRPSCGDGREFISIQVMDNVSRTRFIELEVGYSDFAELITGLSNVHCDGNIRDLDRVGKKKISKAVIIPMPENPRIRDKDYAEEKVKELLIDGYVSHWGFSSQNSFFMEGGKHYARTTIFKWE